MVVTELERLTAEGAGGAVWRRLGREQWQTLNEALDNPDGDQRYAVQRERARRRQAEREAAEREARRPVCTRCGARFTDARWEVVRGSGVPDRKLCTPCAEADRAAVVEADRIVRQEAEDAAARPTAPGKAKGRGGVFGRGRRR